MTAQIIPVRNDIPAFTLRVDLTQVEFVLGFRFNERDGFWYMSLADALNDPIVSGMRVVIGVPLFRHSADLRRPVGEIVAIDQTNQGRECNTIEEFGDRVVLVYAEP